MRRRDYVSCGCEAWCLRIIYRRIRGSPASRSCMATASRMEVQCGQRQASMAISVLHIGQSLLVGASSFSPPRERTLRLHGLMPLQSEIQRVP